IGKVIVAPNRVSLLVYLHAHPVQSGGTLAFIVEIPAFPASDIFPADIQLCYPFRAMRANIPLPNSVASLCGRGSDCPCNAVDRHGVAVCLSGDMQGSALCLAGKLRTGYCVHQIAADVRKEFQTNAG
ncbi:TPA: hypothetical protein MCU40_005387, partial [Klebsiella pneumoniae]